MPKVPSHRASSSRVYVESTFRSETFSLHNLRVLQQENISIHHPLKDKCGNCCSYKAGNISEQEYNKHNSKIMKLAKQNTILSVRPTIR